jgi:hypothetical protein
MVNVFCDLHHGDLYYSLHLLFEERLGMNLFRPIGHEWFEKGFWKIAEPYHNAPDTIDQFLGVPDVTWSATKEPCQKYGEVQLEDGVYYIPLKVASGEYVQKAVTFDKFLSMDFDFIVATHHLNESAYAELVQKYKPKAAYIMQIGNVNVQPRSCRNVLLAVNTSMSSRVNYIKYYPEHHKDFCYSPPTNHNMVKSFLTNMNVTSDYHLWTIFKRALSDFTFKSHGILAPDGMIPGYLMPQAIKDSAFVWHVKSTGCGGFTDRQTLACGRPCIIRSHYNLTNHSLIKEDMFEDSVNCIDLDASSINESVQKLRYFSEPERHTVMCRNTADKFGKDVNFAEEAEKIRDWLAHAR